MSEGHPLREILRGDLKERIDYVWMKAKEYHPFQKGDTLQDTGHCEQVESNLFKLIPKDKNLSQISLFLLSAAACLHDIGKIKSELPWAENHGDRSKQIILKDYERLGLDRGQGIAVAYIVGVHDHGHFDELPKEPYPLGNESVDLIELACVFKLADMLDTTYKRAPEIVSDIKYEDVPPKWRGRQAITGWYLEKNRIILTAAPKKEENVEDVYTLFGMLKEGLSEMYSTLSYYGYPHELELEMIPIFIEPELKKKAALYRPFPGIAFYSRDDAAIFKGREAEIGELLPIVTAFPISLLIGESGVGKTSLIHAGLFPRLEELAWKCVWTRPFDDVENVKKMIWSDILEGEPEGSLLDVIKKAAEKCKPHKLLVVMDQFEDVLNCRDLDDLKSVLRAVQTGTVVSNVRVLLSFREDALVELSSQLKKVKGSARQFPSVEVDRLTVKGAKEAVNAGLERGSIGLDAKQEEGERELLDIILGDIGRGSDRLYPPYVQIVIETLCKKVDRGNPVITREMYAELGGAERIIANFLMGLLDEFGHEKKKAEKMLIALTSSAGKKVKRSLDELNREIGVEADELKGILRKMVDLRMVRMVGDGDVEIIHDYLGKIVNEELVKEEDRTIRLLKEQLDAFYEEYKMHGTPISSTPFLARLYRYRGKIKIDEEKYPLILCTALSKEGLGWYWLKDMDHRKMIEMVKDHMSHEIVNIRYEAKMVFTKIAQPEDREK